MHDIGVHAVRNDAGEIGFRVLVGGGLGRTPIIGHVIREFLPRAEILNYLDAILRVYNRFGRRDNKYKARIKILVKERTPAVFARHVEARVGAPRGGPRPSPTRRSSGWRRVLRRRRPTQRLPGDDAGFRGCGRRQPRLSATGSSATCFAHKVPGYAIVTLSLKKTGVPPGDATSDQMDAIAELADALQLRRAARLARAEPDLRRRAGSPSCSRSGAS